MPLFDTVMLQHWLEFWSCRRWDLENDIAGLPADAAQSLLAPFELARRRVQQYARAVDEAFDFRISTCHLAHRA